MIAFSYNTANTASNRCCYWKMLIIICPNHHLACSLSSFSVCISNYICACINCTWFEVVFCVGRCHHTKIYGRYQLISLPNFKHYFINSTLNCPISGQCDTIRCIATVFNLKCADTKKITKGYSMLTFQERVTAFKYQ